MSSRLVHGVGINDADYVVQRGMVGNKRPPACPYYQRWHNIFKRCYSPTELIRHPSYDGCSVAPEWHSFMAFRAWMMEQDWPGKELDKDILFPGNKVYGPSTCVFVPRYLNTLLNEYLTPCSDMPRGVAKNRRGFVARIRVHGRNQTLGTFPTKHQAQELLQD